MANPNQRKNDVKNHETLADNTVEGQAKKMNEDAQRGIQAPTESALAAARERKPEVNRQDEVRAEREASERAAAERNEAENRAGNTGLPPDAE